MSASIFGIKTRSGLQNDLFCLQEERDYFQTKYLEQVSEIHSLKEELAKSKKEITRLRMSVMNNDNTLLPDHITATPKNSNGHNRIALTASCSDSYNDDNLLDNDDGSQEQHIAKKDDASSLTAEEIEELLTDEEDETAAAAAEKAVYRTPSRSNKKKNRSSHKDDNDNDNDNDNNDGDENGEVEDVRKSAEKLLQWASYRSRTSNSQRSTSLSRNADGRDSPSVLTSNSVARQPSLLGKMIDTMDDDDDDDDDDDTGNDLSGYHDDEDNDEKDDDNDDDDEEHVVVEKEQKQEEQNNDP